MRAVSLTTSGAVAAGAVAALTCVWLLLFSARFENGATLSGLNPDGGGPGFLLILSAAAVSFFLRPASLGSDGERLGWSARLVDAVSVALASGALTYVLVGMFGSLSEIDREPIVSAVAVAVFVPRVITAALEPLWMQPDDSIVQRS